MECIINIRIAAKFQYNLPYNFRKWNKHSVLRRQSRDTNRNMKVCYCFSHLHDWLIFCHVVISYKFTRFFIYFLFLSVEGPMLETLDYTIRIGSTPTFLYFEFGSLYNLLVNCLLLKLNRKLRKMFLSPRRESNPQPSDLRWDALTIRTNSILNYQAANHFIHNVYI